MEGVTEKGIKIKTFQDMAMEELEDFRKLESSRLEMSQAKDLLIKQLDNENQAFLEMTRHLADHPEGYEGPCECHTCQSYN